MIEMDDQQKHTLGVLLVDEFNGLPPPFWRLIQSVPAMRVPGR